MHRFNDSARVLWDMASQFCCVCCSLLAADLYLLMKDDLNWRRNIDSNLLKARTISYILSIQRSPIWSQIPSPMKSPASNSDLRSALIPKICSSFNLRMTIYHNHDSHTILVSCEVIIMGVLCKQHLCGILMQRCYECIVLLDLPSLGTGWSGSQTNTMSRL